MKKLASVEDYILENEKWSQSLQTLRQVLLEAEVVETIKWVMPTYMVGDKNVFGLFAAKEHVAIWFHQGVFLKDDHQKLVNAGEGVTKAQRQWRFSNHQEIMTDIGLLRQYVLAAIENQYRGLEMKPERKKALSIPEELNQVLEGDNELMAAFNGFTSFKQREFADYITGAKRKETKQTRIQKIIPMILEGIGLNDKYRKG